MRPLSLLTFSTLYPNAAQPNHGVFVENRLRHLVGGGDVLSTVLAPVPFFPSGAPALGRWSVYGRVPKREVRHGLDIHHPRFPVIPKLGMSVAPALLFRASLAYAQRLLAEGLAIDAIDAHYLYPDGVAAVMLGRALGRPVVVTARGTDVSHIPDYRIPRTLLRRALAGAAGIVAVSAALAEALGRLGIARERVRVLRNGVDLKLFRPVDRAAARAALGLTRTTLLSVGHLIERKGHHRVIETLTLLPACDLLIVGEGPERANLEALAAAHGLAGRVRFLGACPHDALADIYGAADLLVLASSREGWANVLLEAMACGTPVVASPVWGNPEVVREAAAGVVAQNNTPESLADAIEALLASPPERGATRAYAERFGWDETTAGQLALFRDITGTA